LKSAILSRDLTRSRELSRRAHELIPGGAHTYSKGDDQFPENAPRFIARGAGTRIWDVDGNEYLDWTMGLRTVILGHAHPRVLAAVAEQLPNGSNFARPSPVELALAELLHRVVPSAEMVKFCKNGSDATTAAVRLARAHTGRDVVALCRDTAFFSVDDWFIGTTPMSRGIPAAVTHLSVTFRYNDIEDLRRVFAERPGQIAAVVMEAAPANVPAPDPSYLAQVRELVTAEGAVLIFDEIITGFRWHLGGAQAYFGVRPDLAAFGKAMANGFSVSAVAGRREIMELGGIQHTSGRVFLLSSTHGGETHELAAAIATISELEERAGIEHIWAVGQRLKDGITRIAASLGVAEQVRCEGYPCSPYLVFRDRDGRDSAALRTLFVQETIEEGVLMPYLAPALAHSDTDVDRTLEACERALRVYRDALEAGTVEGLLRGAVTKPVFRERN
jgi:glutamate-1-semialdehyde 2,1-aminomutase